MDWIEQTIELDKLYFATHFLMVNFKMSTYIHQNYLSMEKIRHHSSNFNGLEVDELNLIFDEIIESNVFNENISYDIPRLGSNAHIFDTCNSIDELIYKLKNITHYYSVNIMNLFWDTDKKKYGYYIGII